MARSPAMQQVDFFPHMTRHGQTLFIVEKRFGNDGYAFWFKILEMLGSKNGHALDAKEADTWEFIQARTLCSETQCTEILTLLAKLEAIDRQLWEEDRVIWSQNLVDNLRQIYAKRKTGIPCKPHLRRGEVDSRSGNDSSTPIPDAEMPQRRGEERIGTERNGIGAQTPDVQNPDTTPTGPDLENVPVQSAHAWAKFRTSWDGPLLIDGKFMNEEDALEALLEHPLTYQQQIACSVENYKACSLVQRGIGIKYPNRYIRDGTWRNHLAPPVVQPLGNGVVPPEQELIAAARDKENRYALGLSAAAKELFAKHGIAWPVFQRKVSTGEIKPGSL